MGMKVKQAFTVLQTAGDIPCGINVTKGKGTGRSK